VALSTWCYTYTPHRHERRRAAGVDTRQAELRECFALIDEDGSGAIDVDEMHTAFNFLGVAMSQKEVEEMFAQVDEDGSGEIEFDEFIEVDLPASAASAPRRDLCLLGPFAADLRNGSRAVGEELVFPGCLSMPDTALQPPFGSEDGRRTSVGHDGGAAHAEAACGDTTQVMTNVESAKAEKTAAELLNGPPKSMEQLREEAKVAPLPFPLMALAYKRRKFFEAAFDDEVRFRAPVCLVPVFLASHGRLGCISSSARPPPASSSCWDIHRTYGVCVSRCTETKAVRSTGTRPRGGQGVGEARPRAQGEHGGDEKGVQEA
jgi:centrin-1